MEKYLLKNEEEFNFAKYRYSFDVDFAIEDEPEQYPCLLIVFGKDANDIDKNLAVFVYENEFSK